MNRGDIYYADLGEKEEGVRGGETPVLVIQNNKGNNHGDTVIVAVIVWSKRRWLPTHMEIHENGSLNGKTVKFEQIQTINKNRLKRMMGHIKEKHLDMYLKISLGIE